jgi:aminoglycoside phosphotransferase (APT) family kinase protein
MWLRMTDSEVEITVELVCDLLQEQHPDLAGLAIREVAGGWSNQQWRLGDELAVRMPRTEGAPDLLRKERRWLPVLAPRLPLPVPNPVRIGEPSARFSKPWTIMTWVPGERDALGRDRLRCYVRRRSGVGPRGRMGHPSCGRRLTLLRRIRAGRRGDDSARPRAGRPEEPVPHADGSERRPGPSWRQADMGTRRSRGARSRSERRFDVVARSGGPRHYQSVRYQRQAAAQQRPGQPRCAAAQP